jgi:hypothetical protein
MVKETQRFYMNLFVKLLNFNFVFGLSFDCFNRSRFSKEARMKKNENWPSFWPFNRKIYSFFQKAFMRFAYFIVDIYAMPWKGMYH